MFHQREQMEYYKLMSSGNSKTFMLNDLTQILPICSDFSCSSQSKITHFKSIMKVFFFHHFHRAPTHSLLCTSCLWFSTRGNLAPQGTLGNVCWPPWGSTEAPPWGSMNVQPMHPHRAACLERHHTWFDALLLPL